MSLSHPSRESHGRKERVSKEMQEQAGVTRKLPRSGLVQLPLIDIASGGISPSISPLSYESHSRCHVREWLRCRTAAGLGFVRFRQLSGAGARDFGVRLLTARQRGPPALFHKFLLPP